MGNYKDITGRKYHRLTAEKRLGQDKHGRGIWLFRCDCGNKKAIDMTSVITGHTVSCGCFQREVLISGDCRRQHGMCNSRIYHIWKGIHSRCNHPSGEKNSCYKSVSYCKEWEKFEPFYEWAIKNGYKDNLSIDRIDNSKGYSPNNCRWATVTEQANNKSNNHFITYDGKTKSVARWMKEMGFCPSSFYRWVKKGWKDEEIIAHFAGKLKA